MKSATDAATNPGVHSQRSFGTILSNTFYNSDEANWLENPNIVNRFGGIIGRSTTASAGTFSLPWNMGTTLKAGPTQVPAQFKPGLSGCGAIVFWTKARTRD